VDLTGPADILPPRTRHQYAIERFARLRNELESVPALQAAGVLSEELDVVDQALRGGPFIVFLRDPLPMSARFTPRTLLASQAAEVLERIQSVMPAAARAGGKAGRAARSAQLCALSLPLRPGVA
jgi:hypothetical protein